jgi:hypothetical protein
VVETAYETAFDRIVAGDEDDRYGRTRSFGLACRNGPGGSDHGDPAMNQIGRQPGQEIVSALRPAYVERVVAAFDHAVIAQPLFERIQENLAGCCCTAAQERYSRGLSLRACRERPCSRRAADQPNELPPSHSITSSARASTDGGTSRPSALAVLRLMTSSNLVGACTGRSAGFSPLRMRST